MSAIFVEVTAEQIAACVTAPSSEGFDPAWAKPLEMAIEALSGQSTSIDSDGDGGYIATIGQGEWTLVLDLPAEANRWLDARWNEDRPAGPEIFRIPIPTWLVDLLERQAIDA